MNPKSFEQIEIKKDIVGEKGKLLTENLEVIVATCDKEIADVIEGFGGNIVFTNKDHLTGTTRVAEAVEKIDCSHVILLQGDEPLIYPTYIDTMVEFIKNKPDIVAWNATAPINNDPKNLVIPAPVSSIPNLSKNFLVAKTVWYA